MEKGMKSQDSYFKTTFNSNSSEVKFKSNFTSIDSGSDFDLDLLIIFDGGDVNGYEKDLKDSI